MLIFLITSSVIGLNPTYQMEIKNDQQTANNEFIFDIYIKNIPNVTWPDYFELASIQAGIKINSSVLNGGVITPTIVAGYSDLLASQQQTNANLTMAGSGAGWGFKMTLKSPLPGAGAGTHITNAEMRVCRIKLTNSVPFTAGAQLNFVWNNAGANPWATTVAAYLPGLTALTSNNVMTNFSNPYLNAWNGLIGTDWSNASNWSPSGVPTNSLAAYIPASANQPHVTALPASPATCNALTIAAGATLTIDPGKALTASGATTITGSLLIASDATGTGSFIDNGTVTGNATVQKYLTDHRWWYLGAPLSNATAVAFTTLSGTQNSGNRLFYWDEGTQLYVNVTNTADAMPALRGYSFKSFDASPLTASFTGTLNTASFGGAANLSYSSGTTVGYNLVSNPYPSAINFDVTHNGITPTNLEPSIWYRTNSTFATYNYTSGLGQNNGQAIIPAMQAFWVRVATVAGGGLQITPAARVHNTQAFYKTPETNVFRINLSDGTTNDEAVISFHLLALNTFEDYDSKKMFATDNTVAQLYSITSDNNEVAINGQNELTSGEERIVTLGFANAAGTFTFNASNIADFDPAVSVYLEDALQNSMINLRKINSYTFNSADANNAGRFKVHFINKITGIPVNSENNISVYNDGYTIYINTAEQSSIDIFNAIGEKILTKQVEVGLNKIQLSVDKGIYLVKVQTKSTAFSKKIYLGY
jgi:hypothetical protein